MIIPVGDTPNPPGKPLVTWLLMAANVAVYLWVTVPLSSMRPDAADPLLLEYIRLVSSIRDIPPQVLLANTSAYDLFLFRYGFRPADPGIVSLLSAMFLHAGFMHLFGNMLFLWIYGDNVEYRLGHLRFLFAYLATGVAASLFFAMFAGSSNLPMIGASGAISGVLGFYFLWFPGNRIKLFFFFFPFFMDTVLIPARLVLGFYLVIENLLPFFLTPAGGGGVAYGAHIGGFLAGLAGAAFMGRSQGGPRRSAGDGWFSFANKGGDPPALFTRAVRQRNLDRAAGLYRLHDSAGFRSRVSAADLLDFGDGLLQAGRYSEALRLFRRFIAEHPQGPGLDKAYLGCGLAAYYGKKEPMTAYHYFLQALDVAQSEKVKEDALRHIRIITNGRVR